VVTFQLGVLDEVFLQLKVTIVPLKPGAMVNAVRIRGNEREQTLANNASNLTVEVTGAVVPQSVAAEGLQPRLHVRMMADGLAQIEVTGATGAAYTLETSVDLVNWKPVVEFLSTTPTTRLTEVNRDAIRFYRAVRQPATQ
jgi:hypothetical protein